jgi:type II secretory pathway pseudopilin PulG
LIELTILLAIVGLALVLVAPQFELSYTRRNVSRAKFDLRSLSLALEGYRTDRGTYPISSASENSINPFFPSGGNGPVFERLSTPIAYMGNSALRDPVSINYRYPIGDAWTLTTSTATAGVPSAIFATNCYLYSSWNSTQHTTYSTPGISTAFLIQSVGPDQAYYNTSLILRRDFAASLPYTSQLIYDPTNGAVSRGSIWRLGGYAAPTANYAAGEGFAAAVATSR